MEHICHVETTFGQVLLADPAVRAALHDDLVYWLGVLFDPHGESQLTADFDEPWDVVLARAKREMTTAHASGFVMLRTPGGRLTLRLQDHALDAATQARVALTAHTHVTVTSGALKIADAFEGWESAPAIPMAAGEYRASVHTLRVPHDPSQIVGVLGDGAGPALVIVLEPTDSAPSDLSLIECHDESWPTKAAPQRLCRAEVKKVEDGVAILKLKVTEQIYSGYGRLAVSESTTAAPGERLLVRLREYTGSYWWCSKEA